MLSYQDKQKIYGFLSNSLKLNESYPLSLIAGILNENHLGNRDFGYSKMRPYLEEMREFIDIYDLVVGKHMNPQQDIVIREWNSLETKYEPVSPMVTNPAMPDEVAKSRHNVPKEAKNEVTPQRGLLHEEIAAQRSGRHNESQHTWRGPGVTQTAKPNLYRPKIKHTIEIVPYMPPAVKKEELPAGTFPEVNQKMKRIRESMHRVSYPPREEAAFAPSSEALQVNREATKEPKQEVRGGNGSQLPPRVPEEEKPDIYRLLLQGFPVEEAIAMAQVGYYLKNKGYGRSRYGFGKIKSMLSQLPECISIEDVIQGGVPQALVTLHRYEPWEANHISQPAQKAAEPQKREVPAKAVNDNEPKKEVAQTAVRAELTVAQQKEIYTFLTSLFPCGEEIHMAAISKAMNDHGYTKERYGFQKMKYLLQSVSFISMEEMPINGVVQQLLTLHRVVNWDLAPAKQTEKNKQAMPRKEEDPVTVGEVAEETIPHEGKMQEEKPGKETMEIQTAAAGAKTELPQRIDGDIYFSTHILAKYAFEIAESESVSEAELQNEICRDYAVARAKDAIGFRNGAYVFDLQRKDRQGNAMVASIKPSDRNEGMNWYLNFAGYDRNKSAKLLENFAFLGSWSSFLEELAAKALPEPWQYGEKGRRPLEILKRYMQYTFSRLHIEEKICISADGSFAAFNTGLVSQHYDDIYACFEKSMEPQAVTPWRFIEFCTASARGNGKRLAESFKPLPQRASYFAQAEEMLFHFDREVQIDYEHILFENLSRLPLGFIREMCRDVSAAQGILAAIDQEAAPGARKRLYYELGNVIADTPRLFSRMQNRLKEAVELSYKQVQWNFRNAVPAYFPMSNVQGLIWPLSLQGDHQVDVGLAIEKDPQGGYWGRSILTLQQAYIDARLVCRPGNEWLDATKIRLMEGDEE